MRFTGKGDWERQTKIYVDNELIPTLIETGKAERHQEIDHCDVKTSWSLN